LEPGAQAEVPATMGHLDEKVLEEAMLVQCRAPVGMSPPSPVSLELLDMWLSQP